MHMVVMYVTFMLELVCGSESREVNHIIHSRIILEENEHRKKRK